MTEPPYIRIYKGTNSRSREVVITSQHDFFKTEFIIASADHEKLTLRIPDMDYRGKSYKIHIGKKELRYFNFTAEDIPSGKFEIDEESNEDELIIYFND